VLSKELLNEPINTYYLSLLEVPRLEALQTV